MATLVTLKKNGEMIKTKVQENCETIWAILTGASFDPNNTGERFEIRDYIKLTDTKGNPMIVNKRYVFKIYED